jgi:hypothetical protein
MKHFIQTCLKCDPNMLQKCIKCDRHMYFETWWHSMFFVKTCLKCDSNMLQSCFLFDRFLLRYIVIGTCILRLGDTVCSLLKRAWNVIQTCSRVVSYLIGLYCVILWSPHEFWNWVTQHVLSWNVIQMCLKCEPNMLEMWS